MPRPDLDADVVYDKVFAIAKAFALAPPAPLEPFRSIANTPMRVVPPDTDMPHLAIYMREVAKPYTYGMAATPQFWNVLTITFSGSIKNSNAEKQFTLLRALMKGLNNAVMTDAHFNAMGVDYTGYTRRFRFAQLAGDTIAELVLEHTFEYRTVYPPNITDDYKELHVTRLIHGEAGDVVVHEGSYDEYGNIMPRRADKQETP